MKRKISALSRIIGNTPLLGIHFAYRGRQHVIYAKSEQVNMTGSIKDRMALHILKEAYATGRIRPGDTIAEATSGNTGIAFAAIGRALGHAVTIFMPGWMSRERQDLIRGYGAEVVLVSPEQGGFLGSIRMAEEFAGAVLMSFCLASFRITPIQRRMRRQPDRRSGRSWNRRSCGPPPSLRESERGEL